MFLILYIPTVCALHETQCSSYHTALYISFRLSACCMKLRVSHTIYSDCMRVVRNSVFLIPYIRLHACCMKLSVRHIILRFTFHSGCPRVVRNSVFLIPYIPFARVLHETQCFSYYIFRLYARRTKFSISYTIYPTACVLHETQCSSYHTALYISFRLSARRTKFSVLYHIFRLYARCMKLS